MHTLSRMAGWLILALALPVAAQTQPAQAPAVQSPATDAVKAQQQRAVDQPGNNAPVWREVRKGENPNQVTQVRGIETNVLVQSRGETWRQLRPVMSLAGGAITEIAVASHDVQVLSESLFILRCRSQHLTKQEACFQIRWCGRELGAES